MIGIISFLSTRYAQFAYKYINILEEHKVEYEFVFWNREGDYKENKENWISYNREINSFQPFYKKIFGFLGFTHFMRKLIKENKYEKLIILTTQTAIPLYDILLSKYKNKYIYDYRDVTYENYSWYKKLVNRLVKYSNFTSISSYGFLKVINSNNKTIISHNSRDFKLEKIPKKESNKIRITYWGMVRQLETNYKICDIFAADDRFELTYHGAGFHEELKKYCKSKGYSNIRITGKYELGDIKEFASETDIILNVYENDKTQKNAVTVKFYDSIQYGIPMMVMDESYMSELVETYKLGFKFNYHNKNLNDILYNEFKKFDFIKYQQNRQEIFNIIKEDDNDFERKVILFARGGKND